MTTQQGLFKCPVCWQMKPLNKSGEFAMHRINNRDRYTFCPMSGEPLPVIQPNSEEAFAC
ncbi:hypothetical protein [Mycolicibacterium canariasense]|uniref:hypothetical protein n=1 Tax=Mycolicibacterium canariasense TaxID=228230 RepID=UPI0032D58A5C